MIHELKQISKRERMVKLSAVFQNFHGGPEENWLNRRWYPGCNWNSVPPTTKKGC